MITSIYGRPGFALASFSGDEVVNSTIFYDVESDMTFTQENSTNESNNGAISSKTNGWRCLIDVTIINADSDTYEKILKVKDIINDFNDGKELRVYPRASVETEEFDFNYYLSPYFTCEFDSDIDIEDLVERLDLVQGLDLSFITKELQPLPYYIFDGFPMTGRGTSTDPFGIYSATGMKYLSDNEWLWTDKYFKLLNDIDMTSITEWRPIGNPYPTGLPRFSGTFDGNGKTLSNFNITFTQTDAYITAGLFGRTVGFTPIKNIKFDRFNIVNDYYTNSFPVLTGIVGQGYSFSDISVTNSSVIGTTSSYIGLISAVADVAENISVDSCSVVGKGITGVFGIMEQCFRLNDISVTDSSIISNGLTNYNIVGAVVGWMKPENNVNINNIYVDNNTTVSGNGCDIGGIFGVITELHNKTYSISNIKSLATLSYTRNTLRGSYVGGLSGSIGNFTPTATFGTYRSIVCINTFVDNGGTGTLYVGGVSAYSTNPITSTVEGVFSDRDVSGVTTTVIGSMKTTTQMKEESLYSTFDRDYWTVTNGEYPQLNIEVKIYGN